MRALASAGLTLLVLLGWAAAPVPAARVILLDFDGLDTSAIRCSATGGGAVDGTRPHSRPYSFHSTPGEGAGWMDCRLERFSSGTASAWFYDDGAGCLSGEAKNQTVRLVLSSALGPREWGLGVNTAVSPCTYTVRAGTADAPTAVPRTAGWHLMQWAWANAGAAMAVDRVPVGADTAPGLVIRGWALGPTTPGAPGEAWYDDLYFSSL